MTDRHAQAGGNPAQGPHPDIANPTPSPATGNTFPDGPQPTDERPQDKPDPDAFAARLGTDRLADDTERDDATSDRQWRAPVSTALSSLSRGAHSAARHLQGWSERVVGSGDDSEMGLADLRESVSGIRTAMVTTIDERGTLSSRPLTVQRVTDQGDVWFLVDTEAEWMSGELQAVNVAFVDDKTWVSVAGRTSSTDDPDLLEELWNPAVEAFFPSGRDHATVLQVQSDRWEYWAAPNRVAQLVEIARAKVTDDRPDLGESGAIET